jgi:hypothetical protein
VQLTKSLPRDQFDLALASWGWVGLTDQVPMFTSLFGDVFLRAPDDGWWDLDTIEGALTRVWDSQAALVETLSTDAGRDRYLLEALAGGAAARGLALGANDVYHFMPPPVVGGTFDIANIVVYDFAVAVGLSGQLHDQVRHLPPGTPISGFRVDG